MSGTGQGASVITREVGFPWFVRHARKGCKEIVQFASGKVNCLRWRDAETASAFWRDYPGPDYDELSIASSTLAGIVEDHRDYGTWEEAEFWLMDTPRGGARADAEGER